MAIAHDVPRMSVHDLEGPGRRTVVEPNAQVIIRI